MTQTERRNGVSFAMEVLKRLGDPAMSVTQMASLIGSNPSLSAKLLRIANSPVLGLARRVESVDAAIMLLGFETLRSTMTSQLVSGAVRDVVNTVVSQEAFWNHSLGCALAARLLARKFAPSQLAEAFLAGLLHDVGHLVAPRKAFAFAGLNDRGEKPAHEELGARLASHWQLGETVEEAIRFHHRPSAARKHPVLTATVHLADALVHQMESTRSTFETGHTLDRAAMSILWANESDLSPAALEAALRGGRGRGKIQDAIADIRDSLLEAIGSLEEPERLTLALHYQEGLSFDEIARVLRRREGDVQRAHASAVAKLGTILSQRM